jgi:septal ring factor EnvC (AmiA/AmiB activator)
VIRGFDEADAAGIRRPGLLVATRPRALVTSPWPSTVRYAGPLLDYGNVIILEPQNGYLLVLGGLAEVYGRTGEVVDAGVPVGMMGGDEPDAGTILVETSSGGGQRRTETLYMELRVDQEPQDPVSWFIADAEMGRTQ